MVRIQERFLIKSGLWWWRAYGMYKMPTEHPWSHLKKIVLWQIPCQVFILFLSILLGMSPSSGNDSEKPRMSYAQLIAEGLVNAPDGMLTLSEIYNAISARHPYYKMEARNWQNSIRHNLTLNKSFTKVPRMSSSEGRGSYWKLEPGAESIIFKRSARNVNKSNTVNSANTSLNTSSLNLSGVNLVQTSGGMTEVTTANLVSCEFEVRGRSQTTLTRFWPFLTT